MQVNIMSDPIARSERLLSFNWLARNASIEKSKTGAPVISSFQGSLSMDLQHFLLIAVSLAVASAQPSNKKQTVRRAVDIHQHITTPGPKEYALNGTFKNLPIKKTL
jgi:hypothetical protein